MKWFFENEKKLAKSLLKRKLGKDGKPIPDERLLDKKAESLIEGVHHIVKKRGQNIYRELKEAAKEIREKKGD